MPIQIIAATRSDIEAVVRLNGVVQDHHVRLRPDIFRADWDTPPLRDLWHQRIAEAPGRVVLAMLADAAVGCIWFEVQERPVEALRHAERRIHVHLVAVETSARRRGVGSALMRHIEGEARRLGISEVLLDAWAANGPAQSFYAALGYAPRNMTLAKAGTG